MPRARNHAGLGGTAAVVAASALLAVGLAGGPLYVSSAASEALQVGMDHTCATDTGLDLVLPWLLTGGNEFRAWLDGLAHEVPHAAEPLRTRIADSTYTVEGRDELAEALYLVSRTEQLRHVGARVQSLADGEVLVPAQAENRAQVGTGIALRVAVPADPLSGSAATPVRSVRIAADSGLDIVAVDGTTSHVQFAADGGLDVVAADGTTRQVPPPPRMRLDVVGVFPDIPVRPEPSYWCGWRDLLRPDAFGDPGPLVVLVDDAVLDHRSAGSVYSTWELRPASNELTVHQATELAAGYRRIQRAFGDRLDQEGANVISRARRQAEPHLSVLIDQAHQVAHVVDRTMAPIRLAGVAAAAMLLGGAAVLVARERRRELRLRLLRGEAPWSLAAHVSLGQMIPITIGTVVGAALALLAVVTLGPTPELEPGPAASAGTAAACGALASIVLVGAIAALVASRTVDRTLRRRIPWIPWELVVVGLAALSYRRLDQVGGVRLIGDRARGGDLLAQAFPLLALAAPLALFSRPLVRLARRSRRWGSGLPVPVVSGLRRVGAEPGTSVLIAMATALAVGSFVVSTAMTGSARQLLADKSAVFLGSDVTINVTEYLDLPGDLSGTIVGRLNSRGDSGLKVNVVGIDPLSFAAAVRWRDDAADRSLAELLSVIADPAPGEKLPAIVVGDLDPGTLRTPTGLELRVEQVTSARWFPGERAGSTYVVVNRDALAALHLDVAEQVWLRDPPPDAVARLTVAGFNVGATQRTAEVFDVISFLAVQWSYSALTAFGMVVAGAVILVQLLVLDARRRARQANGVLVRPMGLRTRGLAGGVFTELAIPFVVGAAAGIAVAVAVLHVAVSRLDTLRQLKPPARVVIDLSAMGTAVGIVVVALVALTLIGVEGIRRADPMEVMRSAG